ncbi:hypothetical protein BC834DRAFT_972544 [Gloeopeniophorella convolvens]|nr:hypothetical protein BC834DRAFT_972544 [Gloeopeniophorella convolvens]
MAPENDDKDNNSLALVEGTLDTQAASVHEYREGRTSAITSASADNPTPPLANGVVPVKVPLDIVNGRNKGSGATTSGGGVQRGSGDDEYNSDSEEDSSDSGSDVDNDPDIEALKRALDRYAARSPPSKSASGKPRSSAHAQYSAGANGQYSMSVQATSTNNVPKRQPAVTALGSNHYGSKGPGTSGNNHAGRK